MYDILLYSIHVSIAIMLEISVLRKEISLVSTFCVVRSVFVDTRDRTTAYHDLYNGHTYLYTGQQCSEMLHCLKVWHHIYLMLEVMFNVLSGDIMGFGQQWHINKPQRRKRRPFNTSILMADLYNGHTYLYTGQQCSEMLHCLKVWHHIYLMLEVMFNVLSGDIMGFGQQWHINKPQRRKRRPFNTSILMAGQLLCRNKGQWRT